MDSKLKLEASQRVPHKVKIAARNKKRRGESTQPAFSKKPPPREIGIALERQKDAIIFLREATKVKCHQCGALQPRIPRTALLTMLARASLEEG